MNRWLVRSTIPMALLIALGLVALIGTLVVPATTVESQYSTATTAGVPGATPAVTVDHQGTALAILLLVVALGSFAGAVVLGVLRRRNRTA
jgi:hypothetical protein